MAASTLSLRRPHRGCSSPRAVVLATVDAFPTCGCGQALDTCRARHCPRCGVAVEGPAEANGVGRHARPNQGAGSPCSSESPR